MKFDKKLDPETGRSYQNPQKDEAAAELAAALLAATVRNAARIRFSWHISCPDGCTPVALLLTACIATSTSV